MPNNKTVFALVSHEDRSPPQMWRIDMKKVVKAGELVARLMLVHSKYTFDLFISLKLNVWSVISVSNQGG